MQAKVQPGVHRPIGPTEGLSAESSTQKEEEDRGTGAKLDERLLRNLHRRPTSI
jgi:hypothetical protein